MSEVTQVDIDKANEILKNIGSDTGEFSKGLGTQNILVAFYGIQDHLIIMPGEIDEDSIKARYLKMLLRVKVVVDESIAAASKL